MDSLSLYLNILREQFHDAIIIPFASTTTLPAMAGFGQDITLALIVAIIASIFGNVFNWWLGRALFQLANKKQSIAQKTGYQKSTQFFNRYLLWLLFLSWVPLFNVYVVASGFLGTRLRTALPLIAAGQISYFVWFYLLK